MKSLHSLKSAVVVFFFLITGMCTTQTLFGQDKAAEKTQAKSESKQGDVAKSSAASEANQGSTSDSYRVLMDQWKMKEDQLKAMEADYIAAGQARRNEIRTEYNKLLDEVKKLVVDLRNKAIETYEKNPNQDESLIRLLIGMLTDDLQKRRFEEFFHLGDVLIKGKCDVSHFEALRKAKRLVAFGTDDYIDELIARHGDGLKGDLPRAVIKTSYGEIEIELFEDNAPNHVANFISLASKKFYDGSKWHRVDKAQNVVQGGQPKDGKEIDYTLAGEWDRPNRRRHFKGNVGAARTPDPNSASSQFYIVTDRVRGFDVPGNSYTVFGRVIKGMEFVHQIEQDSEMQTVEIIRKRDHEYVPKPYKPEDDAAKKGDPASSEKGQPETKSPDTKSPETKTPEKKSSDNSDKTGKTP